MMRFLLIIKRKFNFRSRLKQKILLRGSSKSDGTFFKIKKKFKYFQKIVKFEFYKIVKIKIIGNFCLNLNL